VDELQARTSARAFLARLSPVLTVDVAAYAKAVNARIRYEALERGESGYTVPKAAGFVITVNSEESPERQRFTVCHEIAHILLRLPMLHGEVPSWSYTKRDLNEVWCDIFASELLMPSQQFSALIPKGEPSIGIIDDLAQRFGASFPATASRYATLAAFPCAYVTMENGVVRYAGPNAALRRRGIRMSMKCPIPGGSVAERLRRVGESSSAVEEVAQDIWLENCDAGYDLWELSRHFQKYDQTISLLWCTEEELPKGEVDRFNRRVGDDDGGLEDLDGVLTWEKHGRRR
jgi:Zn-dependent peptidase ImmA (M78 family)